VRVTDPGGTVLATADLAPGRVDATSVPGVETVSYSFRATVPPEPRYGIEVGSITPYYVAQADFVRGVSLSTSC
jgi:hypothetical protein